MIWNQDQVMHAVYAIEKEGRVTRRERGRGREWSE